MDKLAHKWDAKLAVLERLQAQLKDTPRHAAKRLARLRERIATLQKEVAALQVGGWGWQGRCGGPGRQAAGSSCRSAGARARPPPPLHRRPCCPHARCPRPLPLPDAPQADIAAERDAVLSDLPSTCFFATFRSQQAAAIASQVGARARRQAAQAEPAGQLGRPAPPLRPATRHPPVLRLPARSFPPACRPT